MTAEHVFEEYRAYKFHYEGTYDYAKYRGNIRCPPLLSQRDRQFYYRLANKLTDPAIHALFTYGFFYKPKAHVSELATTTGMSDALLLSGRAENGLPLLKADIYDLHKRVPAEDLDEWLYGRITGKSGSRDYMPGCIQDVMAKRLPLDLACIVLLVPQPQRNYAWTQVWDAHPSANVPIGPFPWIDRLKKLDQLLNSNGQWHLWRHVSHQLAQEFWSVYPEDLSPRTVTRELTLF